MAKVREVWQWLNKDYDEMTEEGYDRHIREEKIAAEDVLKWAEDSGVHCFELRGGLKGRGWTGHDIEFVLRLPRSSPWACNCRNVVKKLDPTRFLVPISGYCAGCGAGISWDRIKKEWRWLWRYNNLEFVEKGIRSGVTLEKFLELIDRVKELEKRVR